MILTSLILMASTPINVSTCVVETKHKGFQCTHINEHGKKTFRFTRYAKGTDLICSSPTETAKLLKGCQQHIWTAVTKCSYSAMYENNFLCQSPCGDVSYKGVSEMNGYYCFNEEDRQKLLGKCMELKSPSSFNAACKTSVKKTK